MTETPVVVANPRLRGATPDLLDLRVQAVRYEARGVHTYELCDPHGGKLPEFTAGAHIDLNLRNGLVRSYSLCNSPRERHRYLIGVQRDPSSRGGSRFIHDSVGVGDLVRVSPPRNNFELVEDDATFVLVAGGIGITPLLAMIYTLSEERRPWQLHYAVRKREQLAFLDELERIAAESSSTGQASIHVDEEAGSVLALPALVNDAPDDAQLYCCGPAPMLDAFVASTAEVPEHRRHIERFTNTEAPATEGGFVVELAASGLSVDVAPGQTILDAVETAGVSVAYSCMDGVCGTCETRVLEGEPDHRDQVLTDREKASKEVIMICCSGSNSPRLVLDL